MSEGADLATTPPSSGDVNRRRFLQLFSAVGVTAAFPGTLWALAAKREPITRGDIAKAAALDGVELTEAQQEMMLKGVNELRDKYEKLRAAKLANAVAPALLFDPLVEGVTLEKERRPFVTTRERVPETVSDVEQLAFLPVTALSQLIRSRRVSSEALTRMYLARLKRFDPILHCVITLTEKRALERARRADQELSIGIYRGPLHGIPWGAKDLLAVRGYPTTWGATPYKDQVIDEDATVVKRLDEAGAVLVAKLSLGALASGDVWFGGKTRNPWKPDQGSSGSSAGPASAVAAGLVGFAVGSETRGSILSPCTRCGATGLRPTFGRVSRHGAMALSWSMDKLGPVCRSVEDCAVVLHAIAGPDGEDETVRDVPFNWDPGLDVGTLTFGYLKSVFEAKPDERRREWHKLDLAAVEQVRSLGVELVPIELPDVPVDAMSFILDAEAAAAFDQLTVSGRDKELVRQDEHAWPNTFREARTIPAVEYIQANRLRRIAMREMARVLDGLDGYLSPTFGGSNLALTNLTGHPAVVVPDGFRTDGTPTSITFMGNLFGEAKALALAKAYQDATGFQLRHPDVGV